MGNNQPAIIEKGLGHQLLKKMLLIRRFEEACVEQYSAGHIRGFLHLYIGEEAIATGVMDQLSDDDYVFATYREHGHALARGLSPRVIMAEMFGKEPGCCKGRGGSMHLFSKEHNLLGGNAIVAGGMPLAVGTALADSMRKKDRISVCIFGEGAMAEGEFHESLNLAALWNLPVLFLCENNFYAMGSALERTESSMDFIKKVEAYNVRGSTVDGMDVMAVRTATKEAIQHIHESGGPYFLECQTYRFRAHSMFDAELYREKSEVEEWKKQDPILLFTETLKKQGSLEESELRAFEQEIAAAIEDSITFANEAPYEDVENLYRHVHWES